MCRRVPSTTCRCRQLIITPLPPTLERLCNPSILLPAASPVFAPMPVRTFVFTNHGKPPLGQPMEASWKRRKDNCRQCRCAVHLSRSPHIPPLDLLAAGRHRQFTGSSAVPDLLSTDVLRPATNDQPDIPRFANGAKLFAPMPAEQRYELDLSKTRPALQRSLHA